MSSKLKQLLNESSDLVITPLYRAWLVNHADDAMPPWVVDLITAQMLKGDRDRTGSFGSSSAGGCLRLQELEFLGVNVPESRKPEPRLANIFNDGKWRHLRWQANLLMAGILHSMEFPLSWPAMRSVGTMDGQGTVSSDHPRKGWRGKEFGFELKGWNPFLYTKQLKEGEIKEEHLDQVHRYFLSSGLELFVIVYENKGDGDWHEWVIEPDPRRLVKVQQELDDLNMAVDSGKLHVQLPSCAKRTGPTFDGCKFGGPLGPCEAARSALMKKWKQQHEVKV